MTAALCLASFAAGMVFQWALAAYRVRKSKAVRREFRAALRSHVDLEPTEFSANWEARS